MKQLLASFLLLMLVGQLAAQEDPHQLSPEDAAIALARQEAGLYEEPAQRTTALYTVGLAFHVVRTSAGTGGIAQSQLDQAMLDLEDAWAGSNICFYLAEQDTINSTTYYYIDNDTEADNLRGINDNADLLDCYFVGDVMGYCGMSTFSWYAIQGILYTNSCVGTASNPSTFPHEIGHYFDLFHTHETAVGTECPDGSNCDTAGDLVCDTPADPGLGSSNVNTSCVYTGSSTIYCNGATRSYNPDPENLMSYSRKTCRTEFTPAQFTRARATLYNERLGEDCFYSGDYQQTVATGWDDTIVPRNTTGATSASTHVTSTLPGNSSSTYLNVTLHNDSSGPIAWCPNRIYIDNVYTWGFSYGDLGANAWRYYNNFGSPFTVRGGRHALQYYMDYGDTRCELSENNNLRSVQYVWSPMDLANGDRITRSIPPERMNSTFTYDNCDGYQFSNSTGWWHVVSVSPLASSGDYDAILYDDYTGSTTGFATSLASSYYGGTTADWVLVNRNQSGTGTYQMGAERYNGTSGGMVVAHEASSTTFSLTEELLIEASLEADQVLGVFEVLVGTSDTTHAWDFLLNSEDASSLGMYLYSSSLEHGKRSDYIGSSSYVSAEQRVLRHDFSETGYFALVVYKTSPDYLSDEIDFEIETRFLEPSLEIERSGSIRVALIQDSPPWSVTSWEDEMDLRGISYDVLPSTSFQSFGHWDYDVVISSAAYNSLYFQRLVAAQDYLSEYVDQGGVLVMNACTMGGVDTLMTGITMNYAPIDTIRRAIVHPISWQLPSYVLGNSAAHVNFENIPAGWEVVMNTYPDYNPTVLVDDDRGVILMGTPVEYGYAYNYAEQARMLRNILDYAMDRAARTVRVQYQANTGTHAVATTYCNTGDSVLDYINQESYSWLNKSPFNGIIAAESCITQSLYFLTNGQTEGLYRGYMEADFDEADEFDRVHLVLELRGLQPLPPMNLSITPVDFDATHAQVFVEWDPVTHDIHGDPISIEGYILYYAAEPWAETWNYGVTYNSATTSGNLYFHNVGLLDHAYMYVVAYDQDGMIVASSNPDAPQRINTEDLQRTSPLTRSE